MLNRGLLESCAYQQLLISVYYRVSASLTTHSQNTEYHRFLLRDELLEDDLTSDDAFTVFTVRVVVVVDFAPL
jgi:hypothetical protein